MKAFSWLVCALFPCLFISCVNDAVKHQSTVTGYWTVDKAFRDKKETRLLADVFFQFGLDGKMLTNLPNTSENSTDFELKGPTITQKSPEPVLYNILDISDSTLVLAMEMNNTPFEIHLKKGEPPAVPVDSIPEAVDTLR